MTMIADTNAKKTINDFRSTFVRLISKNTNASNNVPSKLEDDMPVTNSTIDNDDNNLVEEKTFADGLNTSSFTVCARVRPMLPHEKEAGDFVACLKTNKENGKGQQQQAKANDNTDQITVCTPKINFRGQPKLETKSFCFDHVFGSDSTNKELAAVVIKPLVKRALDGQVGVIFAYGQTGSGKTHSMNGVMDYLLQSPMLFNTNTCLSFSYIEILGTYINDCLGPNDSRHSSKEAVAIGETMDGRVVVRNVSSHAFHTSEDLLTLVDKAKELRSTAATEKNATSSRSHGIGIITCTDKQTGIEGSLYVIDLAGSERAADSKDHDKERMAETKAINASLSTLKDCIQARTVASKNGRGGDTHIPYRRSKLTLLMKDVFDAGCTRLCSTVVLATCSPLASDISHSANTLKYSSPLCGNGGSNSSGNKAVQMQVDVSDPTLWNNKQVIEWVANTYPSVTKPSTFVGELSGVQLCALPEKEYYSRVENAGISRESSDGADHFDASNISRLAKDVYLAVWTLISDAKTRKRRKDGTIITEEDEEKERLKVIADTEKRARIWAEREKHLVKAVA